MSERTDLRSRDEVLAIFDDAGREVGTAPRSRAFAEGLWLASAGVLLRSLDGGWIYVHRRSHDKEVFAGLHDCIAGGGVDPGESPEQTARRELGEELGVTGVALSPLARISWDGSWAGRPLRCHLHAFEGRYDGPIRHQDKEIADGGWWTEASLRRRLVDPSWPFAPHSRALLGASLGWATGR
ncbi:NUDIX hydrolase [Rhodococcus sp. NPDC055112]